MKQYRMMPWLMHLHRDDRGNLGVLLLMTILALVGLLGLIWNTAEYGTRRQNLQNASDAAAHAAHTWVARDMNLVTATNILMCENASAQAILLSITPAITSLQSRLTQEQQNANRLLVGNQPGSPKSNIPDTEYFEELLSLGAWTNSGRGSTLLVDRNNLEQQIRAQLPAVLALMPVAQATQLQTQMNNTLRRNAVGLTYLQNTWLPGLQNLAGHWIENNVKLALNAILNSIPNQQSNLDQFVGRAQAGLAITTPGQLAQRRDAMFDYEHTITNMTPDAIEEQRAKLAAIYKCDITLALPANAGSALGPARITAPLQDAGDVQLQPHTDSIRPRYPQAAIQRFGTDSPDITIDPINVNTDDSTIWHPGVDVAVPPPVYTVLGQTYQGSIHVAGGEYGQVYCAPLARFFNDRVSRDLQGLLPYLTAIDVIRAGVRGQVFPLPNHPAIPNMPLSIPDPVAGNAAIPLPPDPLPTLPLPGGLDVATYASITTLNQQINSLNQRVTGYVNELRNLSAMLDTMYTNASSFIDAATQNYAAWTWRATVDNNRGQVLHDLGALKQFMVLKTYALRPIPDWAKPAMWSSAQQYVSNAIYTNDLSAVTLSVQNALQQWLTTVYSNANFAAFYKQGLQAGLAPPQAAQQAQQRIRQQAQMDAAQEAPSMANVVVARGADIISREVADEWITRQWPYEITPPNNPVPPTAGMGDSDRINYFTLLAAAKTNANSSPRLVMPRFFSSSNNTMVTYAQAETFNWMEFNAAYGAAERFDQVTDQGWNVVSGSPSCWRLSTTGGWNWHPRLAVSDARVSPCKITRNCANTSAKAASLASTRMPLPS